MPPPDGVDDPPEEAVADPIDGYAPPVLSARQAAGSAPPGLPARQAAAGGSPGGPAPGEPSPPPTVPVPDGRGGDQVIPRPLNAIAGGPAPWADLPADRRRPTLAEVRSALAASG